MKFYEVHVALDRPSDSCTVQLSVPDDTTADDIESKATALAFLVFKDEWSGGCELTVLDTDEVDSPDQFDADEPIATFVRNDEGELVEDDSGDVFVK